MSEKENAQMTEAEKEMTNPVRVIESTMRKLIDAADVQNVYGEPIEKNGIVVVPAAEVMTSMGFGSGSGQDSGDGEDGRQPSGGSGGGGGGHTFSRPVAVIIIKEDCVRVEPVVDVTKISLAFFTAFGFIVATLMKMRRSPGKK